MKKLPFVILTALMFLLSFEASAQSGQQVKGRVVDDLGNPLIGVTILEESTMNGTITDIDGNFSLVLDGDEASLTFNYVGYTPQTVVVGSNRNFDIALSEATLALDQVVVVGYGVQKKKLVTGATSQVSSDDLNDLSSNGIMGALQSKTTGVNVSSASGMPGEGSKITIRGIGTVGNSEPLVVIDGVAGASMGSLNPSDIESIDILKDAASAAIYGSRAANGVILITTKRGKAGKYQISYDGYFGVQNVSKDIESLDAKGYMDIMDEMRNPDPTKKGTDEWATLDWENLIPSKYYDAIMDGSWTGTEWLHEIENKNAAVQNHAISLIGGSERSRFSAAYSYSDQEGVYGMPVVPEYMRHNARVNVDNTMYQKGNLDIIKVGAGMIYSYTENNGIALTNRFDNDLRTALTMPSIYPLFNDEGDYYDLDDFKADGWAYSTLQDYANPVGLMRDRNVNKTIGHRLFANTYLEIQPIKNLKFRSAYGYKYFGNSSRNFTPKYNYSTKKSVTNEIVGQSSVNQYSWTWDNTVSYNFDINSDHNFDFVLGQSLERSGLGCQMSASNSGLKFIEDFDFAWLNNTSGISSATTSVGGYPYVNNSIASFFGRANYNYKEKYMLTAMMRADGSSKFARDNRWGYFPSVSAGWVMSNESWMESTQSWLDLLKVRASWGRNGNCNIANFQYLSTIAYPIDAVYVFGDDKQTSTPGAYANVLANPDVTWEKSEQLDLGIDAMFLDQRLNVVFDYYRKKTTDWLVSAPIPLIYGTGAPAINGGDVLNEGIELGLTWRDNVGDFSYNLNLNGSYNKNKVIRIANADGLIKGKFDVIDQNIGELYRAEVGMPIGYFYGYETDGVFQTQEEIDAAPFKLDGTLPGDLRFVDRNGDGELTDDDKTNIGNPHPDVILGLGATLNYKGFDFLVTANGAFGQQVVQQYRTMNIDIDANYPMNIIEKRWTGPGTSNEYPRLSGLNNFNRMSDIFVQDADYVKIQNITLGYDFNKLWKNSPFQRLRLYATLQNWFTITGYDGFDPAVGSTGGYNNWATGVDVGFYPSPKTTLFGANIVF